MEGHLATRWLVALGRRYRPQLELYRQLAGRVGPEPVRAALYFPWLDEFRELDPAEA